MSDEWDIKDAAEPMVPNHRASADPFAVPTDERERGAAKLFRKAAPRTGADAKRPENAAKAPRKPAPPNKPGQFIEPLTELYEGLAFVLMPIRPVAAMTLMAPSRPDSDITHARRCAIAWDELAQKNENVRRFLAGTLTASVWGALIAAHASIMLALMDGSPLADRLNPATGAEEMLKREAEKEQ